MHIWDYSTTANRCCTNWLNLFVKPLNKIMYKQNVEVGRFAEENLINQKTIYLCVINMLKQKRFFTFTLWKNIMKKYITGAGSYIALMQFIDNIIKMISCIMLYRVCFKYGLWFMLFNIVDYIVDMFWYRTNISWHDNAFT